MAWCRLLLFCGLLAKLALAAPAPFEISGIHPHLAMFNDEGECGTGAVVAWAGKLWVVTYAPHKPSGERPQARKNWSLTR